MEEESESFSEDDSHMNDEDVPEPDLHTSETEDEKKSRNSLKPLNSNDQLLDNLDVKSFGSG